MRYSRFLRLFEGFGYHDDIPDANQGGDCFQVALNYMMSHKSKRLKLCHGLVTGQGNIEGIVYTHAWVEDNQIVIDETIPIKLPKKMYYEIGQIDKKNVYCYTYEEMSRKVTEFKTYGPWEKKLLRNKY